MLEKIKLLTFFLPRKLLKAAYTILVSIYVRRQHHKEISRVRKKNKIKVGFFLVEPSIWKYTDLYFLFSKNPRYEVLVYICPPVHFPKNEQIMKMVSIHSNMVAQGFSCKLTATNDGFLKIRDQNLDLCFLTTPWNLTIPEYSIDNMLSKLTCYVHYGYQNSYLFENAYNRNTQNFCWKYFVESEKHNEYARKYSSTKGKNIVVSGYPGLDPLFFPKEGPSKYKKGHKKLVIWAPHHTIEGADNHINYSTFLMYADIFIELSKQYEDKITFVFKPHPVLQRKLYDLWGVERTEAYYKTWTEDGRLLEEGDYYDLFNESHAMIHDSSSFVIEYLATSKPVLFLKRSDAVFDEFNDIGKEAVRLHYQAENKDEIEKFICDVVFDGKDRIFSTRKEFINRVLFPLNGVSASKNIFNYINEQLEISG